MAGTAAAAVDGLYLHVPFCFHKCHYCDFYSIAQPRADDAAGERQRGFARALTREIEAAGAAIAAGADAAAAGATDAATWPTSIFIGGGTPTLLADELWGELLEALRRAGLTRRVVEWTVEANPETVRPALLARLAEAGVNRMSIGAQSFDGQALAALERWHDPANVARAVAMARDAGIANINIDLIFAIPGQTMQVLEADLEAALALAPEHLSCYSLIYEPNTPLAEKLRQGRVRRVDEDVEAAMYERVMDRLSAAGYEHYEISNWAKHGVGRATPAAADGGCGESWRGSAPASSYRCLHNLHYWHNRNWLGLGPSAASHVDGRRWRNAPHLGRYIAGSPNPPRVDEECLPSERRVGEQLMLGLRLREGVPLDWLESHVTDAARRQRIEQFVEQGLLEKSDGRLRLTRRGLFVADGVIGELL